jgi:hypothetical protein
MLSISLVTFNSERTIQKTLDSLLRHLPGPPRPPAVIVVVDNRSTDGTPGVLRAYARRHAHIRLILNPANVGYGRAHNQALQQVSSTYHVICNPDIILSEDILNPLADFMEKSPQVGILCPRFKNTDGSLQPLNRLNPTVLDLFLRRFLPGRLKPFFQDRLDAYEMRDRGYEVSCDVPFMTGAFMFCRTEVLEAVGGFDERFFLYFEDADLSRRVQNHGYRTVYFPGVSVIHAWERLAHKSWGGSWMFMKSAYQYFRRWGVRLW